MKRIPTFEPSKWKLDNEVHQYCTEEILDDLIFGSHMNWHLMKRISSFEPSKYKLDNEVHQYCTEKILDEILAKTYLNLGPFVLKSSFQVILGTYCVISNLTIEMASQIFDYFYVWTLDRHIQSMRIYVYKVTMSAYCKPYA